MTKKILIYLTILTLLTTALVLIKSWKPVSAFLLECETCINFSASPTTIWRGESSILTLIVDNKYSAPTYAYCTISPGVISNQKLNDGTYNYTVWPGGGAPGNFTYTASCTGGAGTVSDSVTITVNNKASNVPTLIAPPNNVWINYEPTFQASASDPEGDNVKVCFDLDSNGSCEYWTGLAASGSTFSWPTTVPDATGRSWRAKTQDSYGAESAWSGPWTLKKDTVKPSASIDQENGISTDTSIWVNLTESDERSGVNQGDVDVRINGGSWVNTGLPNGGSTIDNFTYTGAWKNTYEFRYKVKDNAGNWSDWKYDGSVYLDRGPNTPTLIAPPNNVWITYSPTFKVNISDPDGDNVKACIDLDSNSSCDYWSSLVSSGSDVTWSPSVSDTSGRLWRAKAQDEHGIESGWSGSWTLKKDTVKPSASIDQENGVSLDTDIWVNLTESDATSGVAEGDVDVRINGGSWVNDDLPNGGSTIDNFIYEGQKGSTYEFRYRVKDNVNWWSDWAYDGSVRINTPPEIISTSETHYYCETDSRAVTFNWEYFDADGDPQVSYQVEIKGGVWDTGEISSSSESYTLPDPTILEWDTTYNWRVRVKDSPGSWSNWANDSFKTPKHQYPDCEFSWSPEYPNAYDEDYPDAPDTAVQFTDESTAYGGTSIVSWSWTFEDGDPATSNEQNPLIKFLSEGDKAVTLEVCDSDGYCCPETKSIYVNFPLPEWKERIPR